MRYYFRFLDFLEKIICYLGIVLMLVMVSSTFLGVLTRYIFKVAIPWTNELAQFCFIAATMLGTAILVYRSGHINITLITKQVPPKVSFGIMLFADLMTLICSLVIMLPGFTFVMRNLRNISVALEVPLWIPMSSMPIAGTLMLLFCIGGIIRLFQDAGKSQHEAEGGTDI